MKTIERGMLGLALTALLSGSLPVWAQNARGGSSSGSRREKPCEREKREGKHERACHESGSSSFGWGGLRINVGAEPARTGGSGFVYIPVGASGPVVASSSGAGGSSSASNSNGSSPNSSSASNSSSSSSTPSGSSSAASSSSSSSSSAKNPGTTSSSKDPEDSSSSSSSSGSSGSSESSKREASTFTVAGDGLPEVPASMFSATGEYVIAYYADMDGIGHGFFKVRPYEAPGQWTGYGFFPNGPLFGERGYIQDDTNHEWTRKLCFRINELQLRQALAKVDEWRNVNYYLVGQNCVSFVYDVDDAIGTDIWNTLNEPSCLNRRLGRYEEHIDNPNGLKSRAEVQETDEQIIDARR